MKNRKFCSFVAIALPSLTIVTFVASQSLPNLRILPLGDSITQGSGSSDGNGYRNRLQQKLIDYGLATGNPQMSVDMIGTLSHGQMMDNDHEGHSGKYLRDINTYWQSPSRARPNVVLVHAGTNNMDKNVDLDVAPTLISEIIDGLFSVNPGVVVLVAPVIFGTPVEMQANTAVFNAQLANIIANRRQSGKKILSVPIDIGVNDLMDKKHPNNAGYEKMARAWFGAILNANDLGWLQNPVSVDVDSLPGLGLQSGDIKVSGCKATKGSSWKSVGTIFDGFKEWEEIGTIRGPVENGKRSGVFLADLNNDGLADYILADDDGSVRAWLNSGRPNEWTSLGKVNPPWLSVTREMIRVADVDNDGKADLILIYENGAARVWKNTDDGKKFTALDSNWATGLAPRENIRVLDIDGDGYADYVILYAAGAVKWARNTGNNGKDSTKKNWEDVQTIAPGTPDVPPGKATLRDLDGDGRADYIIVFDGGAVKALRNSGNLNRDPNRRNWDDLGTIAPGVPGVPGEMIRFADMDGDGRADFLSLAADGSIKMWKNKGIVVDKLLSIRFADLTGDGKDDIISVDNRGRAVAWINTGSGWQNIGDIAPGLDEILVSSRVQFADLNGDKLADYLIIFNDGSVKVFLNNGNLPNKQGRIWQTGMMISPGVGSPGSKVWFPDLNGDGYADYVVVYDDGSADAWLNNKNIPVTPGSGVRIWGQRARIATGVGEAGNKVRFVDITGDGRDEYVVQYDNGIARGFFNADNIPENGKPRNWEKMGIIAGGVASQGPVRYADINGDGKADYVCVYADASMAAWLNDCDWVVKDDEPPPEPTDLPTLPLPIPELPYHPDCYDVGGYTSIDDVIGDNTIPTDCVNTYLIQGMGRTLRDSLQEYRNIFNDGRYSMLYRYYVKAVRKAAPIQMKKFFDRSDIGVYFTCVYSVPDRDNGGYKNRTGPGCPLKNWPDFADGVGYSVYFIPKDNEAWLTEVEKNYGLDRSWIIPTRLIYGPCEVTHNCDEWGTIFWYGIKESFDVPDPAEVITGCLDQYTGLVEWLSDIAFLSSVRFFEGNTADVVDGAGLSVYSVKAAVEAMKMVEEIGQKEQDAELLEVFLWFLTGILALLPGLGQVLGGITRVAMFARLGSAAGVGGEVGMAVYDIVNNPSAAPMAIGGLIFGGLTSRSALSFSSAARKRRDMPDSVIQKLGTDVSTGMGKLSAKHKMCAL